MHHDGFALHPQALGEAAQKDLISAIFAAVETAPFYQPLSPWGRPLSVRQTSLGRVGWITDARGYRYEPAHPQTDAPWPAMPERLLALWRRHADDPRPPDSCLANLYLEGAKMGLHQDADEADLEAPVLGVSLGDTAVFRLGGRSRKDPSTTVKVRSGDVMVLAGSARRCFHGVDRVLSGSSRLVPGGGRLSLTLRRALR